MKAEIFTDTPNELKTIEIDAEKRIFKINGTDFGNGTKSFTINCEGGKGFAIRIDLDTKVSYATYNEKGEKITDHSIERNSQ